MILHHLLSCLRFKITTTMLVYRIMVVVIGAFHLHAFLIYTSALHLKYFCIEFCCFNSAFPVVQYLFHKHIYIHSLTVVTNWCIVVIWFCAQVYCLVAVIWCFLFVVLLITCWDHQLFHSSASILSCVSCLHLFRHHIVMTTFESDFQF